MKSKNKYPKRNPDTPDTSPLVGTRLVWYERVGIWVFFDALILHLVHSK